MQPTEGVEGSSVVGVKAAEEGSGGSVVQPPQLMNSVQNGPNISCVSETLPDDGSAAPGSAAAETRE